MVGVRKIVEDGKIDGEDSHGGTGNGSGGNNPMDRRERRPSKPEQPNREKGAFDASEMKSSLWG